VRLLLDAHLSPRRIGAELARRGHDVLSLADEPELRELDDPEVLALAAEQRRILVTRNGRDFAPLLRTWAEEGRHHAGCILSWTRGHHEFGPIIEGISALLVARPEPEEWLDLSVAL
jgi:hypothetical protein